MSTTVQQPNPFFEGVKLYAPILWIAGVTALASGAVMVAHGLAWTHWMHGWMGGVLVIFSLFKLFDTKAFAADFAKYDLLAMRFKPYARVYPFIELGLGLAFLTFFMPMVAHLLTILVFGFGLIGVFKTLREGRNLQCACVGRTLNLPLSRVAVFENSTMVLMSIIMLVTMAA